MPEIKKGYYLSSIGPMEIAATKKKIVSVSFVSEENAETMDIYPIIQQCINKIDEYFKGKRQRFALPLDLSGGTKFQQEVWKILLTIPFGKSMTYGEIAKTVGKRGAARAVGGACHQNPFVVIVPCHRVIGSTGALTGFGAGLWRKKWLLSHEQRNE